MNFKIDKKAVLSFCYNSKSILWLLLIGIILIFTILLYPNIVVKQYNYKLGDVVEKDIKAPKDFFIEDTAATKAKQEQAVKDVLTVYDYDETLSYNLIKRVNDSFNELRTIIEELEKNQVPEENKADEENTTTTDIEPNINMEAERSLYERIWDMRKNFEDKLGIPVSTGAYQILVKEKFSIEISELINTILEKILANGVVSNKEILLKEDDRGIILRTIGTKEEKQVSNLKHFYGLDQAKIMVRIIGDPILKPLNYNIRNLIVDFAQMLLHPNITLNRSETEAREKQALQSIKPILYQIKEGEMILREGERVTTNNLLKLKNLLQPKSKKYQHIRSSLGVSMIVMYLLIIFYCLKVKGHLNNNPESHQNKDLLFLTTVMLIFLLIAKTSELFSDAMIMDLPFAISTSSIYNGIPMASASMIICLFLGIEIAIPFAMVTAILTAIIFGDKFEIFIYFLLNSIMAAYWTQNCRERKTFIKAGLQLSMLNIALIFAIDIYRAEFSALKLLWDSIFGFLGGISAGIVTAGVAPLVEIIFNYTTDIKLLELINIDQPLLRRLMIEAPGTYNHSLIVGTMAEAGASAIDANPLLARVCGYYHDIGKLKKPLYFIENQANCKNIHDKLSPSMSGLIIIQHVKYGVEIAEQNKLGQAIIDTIKQHHGTSLISFFYEKAKVLKGDESVNMENFKYPGPKPQTKEAAIVMLADIVEAASRTFENPTSSRLQGLVQNLINKAFVNGQLDECNLTLKDLHKIAKSFNTILNGIHHHRIEYPDNQTNGNQTNGNSDRRASDKSENNASNDNQTGQSTIKRLGLSS